MLPSPSLECMPLWNRNVSEISLIMWESHLFLPSVAFWNASMITYWLFATSCYLRGVGTTSSMRAFIFPEHIGLVGAATKDPEPPKQHWERRVEPGKKPWERSIRNQAPWFQTTLQSSGHYQVWYSHKNRHKKQWNRKQRPEQITLVAHLPALVVCLPWTHT